MANVVIEFTPGPTIESFSGLPRNENNIYPRSRISFVGSGTVTAKVAGNTTTIRTKLMLPSNFAYVFDYYSQSIFSATVKEGDQFDNLGLIHIVPNGAVTTSRGQLQSPGPTPYLDTQAGETKMWGYTEQTRYRRLFFNTEGTEPVVYAYLFDNDGVTETAVHTSAFDISFLQYDIRQAEQVVVNAPTPVAVR